ncbi:hypothetical protein M501DRAFT_1011167 [Patellaria atrata CBS 101060]|uniref:Ubiquitin-like domain-containing protein n=1 Tax=Patellaria atrata CBS 101060 TaxID=1346257 RepID=A0A9P4SAX6_9PEZI|nr:hypothetical protein M501DRAFT_1011167 [Patellaria atrata CBS 101060]
MKIKGKQFPATYLGISFRRTIRVADNEDTSDLPPDLGTFPLYAVDTYKNKLPESISEKGGVFFPMYQREAMWINFTSSNPFAVRVFVGGVNAISGDPMVETEDTILRRLKLVEQHSSIQDYLVTSKQHWLDGIADEDGKVRQFVAMSVGSGYSAEVQVTGEEYIRGMQFEITPAGHRKLELSKPRKKSEGLREEWERRNDKGRCRQFFIKSLAGKSIAVDMELERTVGELKLIVEEREAVPYDDQHLRYQGPPLQDHITLTDAGIKGGETLNLTILLRGGGGEMGIAAGGLIKQSIIRDTYDSGVWDRSLTTLFNVQILDSATFSQITGQDPPPTPITAETYAENDLPYFQLYDEKPSGLKGSFDGLKSVNQIDKKNPETKAESIAEVSKSHNHLVITLGARNPARPFRTVTEEKSTAAQQSTSHASDNEYKDDVDKDSDEDFEYEGEDLCQGFYDV